MVRLRWGETRTDRRTEMERTTSELLDDSIEELIAHCGGLLAGYKVPNEVRFEAIPKISTGKIQKFQLRERANNASAIE